MIIPAILFLLLFSYTYYSSSKQLDQKALHSIAAKKNTIKNTLNIYKRNFLERCRRISNDVRLVVPLYYELHYQALDYLQEVAKKENMNHIYLIDKKGQTLSNDPTIIVPGQQINDLYFYRIDNKLVIVAVIDISFKKQQLGNLVVVQDINIKPLFNEAILVNRNNIQSAGLDSEKLNKLYDVNISYADLADNPDLEINQVYLSSIDIMDLTNQSIGKIIFGVDFSKYYQERNSAMLYNLIIFLLLFLSILFLSIILGHFISKPIIRLAKISDNISRGNVVEMVSPQFQSYEIRSLYNNFNNMVHSLLNIQTNLDSKNQELVLQIDERKIVEEKLRLHQDHLEELVSKRTKALQESEERFRLAFNTSPDAITINRVDNGQFIAVNEGASAMLGFEQVEAIGHTVEDLNIWHYPEQRLRLANNLKEIGYVNNVEVEFIHKNGTILVCLLSARIIIINNEQHILAVSRDISKRKQTEKDFKKAKEEAEAANEVKSEFLANISHEIRTPLNAIIGFTELLSSFDIDDKQKAYLESIHIAGRSLLTIINDILDLSKIEAGKMRMNYAPTNTRKILKEIEQIFKNKIVGKNLRFILDIDDNIPNLILDERRLRQILLNIVGNAVKFTETGYIKLAITVIPLENKADKVDLTISVEDTGIGISQDLHEKIFESFRQQESNIQKRYGGTGLGLSIGKKLIEMMNGRITLKSTIGKGSIFNIVLRNIQLANLQLISNNVKDDNHVTFEGGQVLVVDNIEANRDFLVQLLKKAGLEILTAENGQQAINQAIEDQPDVIIMDIKMPLLDGDNAAKQLKLRSDTKDIPIIAVTASATYKNKMNLKELGFDGYLPKPININELYSELANYLQLHNQLFY